MDSPLKGLTFLWTALLRGPHRHRIYANFTCSRPRLFTYVGVITRLRISIANDTIGRARMVQKSSDIAVAEALHDENWLRLMVQIDPTTHAAMMQLHREIHRIHGIVLVKVTNVLLVLNDSFHCRDHGAGFQRLQGFNAPASRRSLSRKVRTPTVTSEFPIRTSINHHGW